MFPIFLKNITKSWKFDQINKYKMLNRGVGRVGALIQFFNAKLLPNYLFFYFYKANKSNMYLCIIRKHNITNML
jgi:hypothetical protein